MQAPRRMGAQGGTAHGGPGPERQGGGGGTGSQSPRPVPRRPPPPGKPAEPAAAPFPGRLLPEQRAGGRAPHGHRVGHAAPAGRARPGRPEPQHRHQLPLLLRGRECAPGRGGAPPSKAGRPCRAGSGGRGSCLGVPPPRVAGAAPALSVQPTGSSPSPRVRELTGPVFPSLENQGASPAPNYTRGTWAVDVREQ